jgi:hypothetical protein
LVVVSAVAFFTALAGAKKHINTLNNYK